MRVSSQQLESTAYMTNKGVDQSRASFPFRHIRRLKYRVCEVVYAAVRRSPARSIYRFTYTARLLKLDVSLSLQWGDVKDYCE
jgi:hypothetical protein